LRNNVFQNSAVSLEYWGVRRNCAAQTGIVEQCSKVYLAQKMGGNQTQEPSNAVTAIKDLTAGSVGGVLQCLSGHPLDTVKVRLQTQATTVPLKYNGAMDCIKKTIAEEGVLGLYKGVQSPLLGVAVMNSALFFSYGQAKAFIQKDPSQELTIPQLYACGTLVGIAVTFVESPVDLFKSQMQVQYEASKGAALTQKYSSFTDCARTIIKNHGIRGMYQGLGATFLRDIPGNAIYFGVYESARRALAKGEKVETLPAWKVLMAGGISGMAYWVFAFPADVVKSSIQADSPDASKKRYHGIMDTIKKVYQANGFRGFWKGFTPCIIRSFPANAVCFFGYEYTRKIIG